MMKRYGAKGQAVINAEFRSYKRVLQTKWKYYDKSVRLGTKAFFRRLYRVDEKALEDWGQFLEERAEERSDKTHVPVAIQSE